MMEYLVHVDHDNAPKDLVVVMVDIPAGVSRASISLNRLPIKWRQLPAPPELARFGDEFVRDARAAILIVPSALAPAEPNWLINPLHPDCSRIRVRSTEAFQYDPRFFR